jgi:hypothetical protein
MDLEGIELQEKKKHVIRLEFDSLENISLSTTLEDRGTLIRALIQTLAGMVMVSVGEKDRSEVSSIIVRELDHLLRESTVEVSRNNLQGAHEETV